MAGLSPEMRPVWNAAVRLGTFTRTELAEAAGASPQRVAYATQQFERLGVIEITGQLARQMLTYRVVRPDAFPAVPAIPQTDPATAEGNMWTAMRSLREFTPLDLAAHAATEEVPVAEAAAAAHCRLLLRAGYLRVLRKAIPGRQLPIYRLIRNTGPRPPRERRVAGLYDPNTQEFVVPKGVGGQP